jgi:hypothetical protein
MCPQISAIPLILWTYLLYTCSWNLYLWYEGMVFMMQAVKYMSLVFRGVVEEYNNTGVRPSVFMDAAGDLQVYICDPIIDDPGVMESINENELEVNGGQFVGFLESSFNAHYNKVRPETELLPTM